MERLDPARSRRDCPPLKSSSHAADTRPAHRLLAVAAGVSLFFAFQFAVSLWKLIHQTGGMQNKFSSLAQEKHLGFLIGENLRLIPAYLILIAATTLLVQPALSAFVRQPRWHRPLATVALALTATWIINGYFNLRLLDSRPYFIHEASMKSWNYQFLRGLPDAIRPQIFFALFTILPILALIGALYWHARRLRKRGWITLASLTLTAAATAGIQRWHQPSASRSTNSSRPNILIISSDSLRGDRLGCTGYRPARSDGPAAAAGVSPAIDALAARSTRFERCYTPIASTLESGTSLMTSQYPHTHGIRQMFPDRQTIEHAQQSAPPLAALLRDAGYDTAALGDWCASYYEIMPLGFENILVSSFDNFKIYMSQAVVMSHFVIPLYFDNPLGYRLFPQINSFADFVTPEVVTRRVEQRLEHSARSKKPFFWHVFYSCNHLKYRSPEPYCRMFADPDYSGPNLTEVNIDIDAFIRGTDLDAKSSALPPAEVAQIRALYDGCTRNFDTHVQRILDALKAQGLDQNTIVILTSDHGDDLYEPGVTFGHGLTFGGGLQSNHIPLILHQPGASPRVIPAPVRLIDIAPTLADLAGVPKPTQWEGRSLAPWLDRSESPKPRPFYGETGFPFIQFSVPGIERPPLPAMDELVRIDAAFNYQFVLKRRYSDQLTAAKQRCLATVDWKLVCTPTADGSRHFGLFHLKSDPHGQHDLATTRPDVLAPMRDALVRWIDHHVETSLDEIFPAGEPH